MTASPLGTQAFIPCSTASLEAGEDLFGTASQVDCYFLLEYSHIWEAKAFESSSLPEAVKAFLTLLMKRVPHSKLLLIKSTHSHSGKGHRFYVASMKENAQVLYEFHLQSYQDLLGLDIPAILEGNSQQQADRRSAPLYLVCANGRRDACCARFGTPVFLELQKQAGADAWESTHMGGHRFAANLLCLPSGILYGRVRPAAVESILEASRKNQVILSNYRGRTFYDEAVQAADYFLRQATGVLELDAFQLQSVQEVSVHEWLVCFVSTRTGQEHRLTVGLEVSEAQIYTSCKPDKLAHVTHYRLLNHDQ